MVDSGCWLGPWLRLSARKHIQGLSICWAIPQRGGQALSESLLGEQKLYRLLRPSLNSHASVTTHQRCCKGLLSFNRRGCGPPSPLSHGFGGAKSSGRECGARNRCGHFLENAICFRTPLSIVYGPPQIVFSLPCETLHPGLPGPLLVMCFSECGLGMWFSGMSRLQAVRRTEFVTQLCSTLIL